MIKNNCYTFKSLNYCLKSNLYCKFRIYGFMVSKTISITVRGLYKENINKIHNKILLKFPPCHSWHTHAKKQPQTIVTEPIRDLEWFLSILLKFKFASHLKQCTVFRKPKTVLIFIMGVYVKRG